MERFKRGIGTGILLGGNWHNDSAAKTRVELNVSAPKGRVKSGDSEKPKSDYKMSDLGFCL